MAAKCSGTLHRSHSWLLNPWFPVEMFPRPARCAMGFNPVQKMCQDQALFHRIRIWERQRYGDFTRKKHADICGCREKHTQSEKQVWRQCSYWTWWSCELLFGGKKCVGVILEGIGDLHPEICHDTLRVDISTCFAFIIILHVSSCLFVSGTNPDCQTLKWRVLTSCFQWTWPSFFQGWKAPVREVDPAKGAAKRIGFPETSISWWLELGESSVWPWTQAKSHHLPKSMFDKHTSIYPWLSLGIFFHEQVQDCAQQSWHQEHQMSCLMQLLSTC